MDLTPEDTICIRGKMAFSFIRDQDHWSKIDYSKLPKVGTQVTVDGKSHSVLGVQVMHGSFGFSKHYIIFTDTNCL